MKARKDVPQGLNLVGLAQGGTAEAVPFVEGIFPSEHAAREA
jgi:hypothetical protein